MNRTIPITRASRFAINLLRGVQSGSVHSVYRKTINLQLQPTGSDAGADIESAADAALSGCSPKIQDSRDAFSAELPRLIALQDRDCVLSALSLCTALSADQLSALPMEEGQTVLADAGSIRIVTPKGMIEFELPADDSSRTSAARKDPNPASPAVQSPAANPIPGLQPALSSVINLNLASHPALPLPADRLSSLSVNINHLLPLSPPGSFARIFCDPAYDSDLILAAARSSISFAAARLRSGEISSAADALCRGLIGLGAGLTPAGDDFLCGVLAGLCLRGAFTGSDSRAALSEAGSVRTPVKSSPAAGADPSSAAFSVAGSRLSAFTCALRSAVPDHLSDTIDISAAFLRCACAGQFSEAVIRLADDAAAGCADSRTIADSFSKIGHSSGFDTLAGIFFSLSPDFAALTA